MSLLQGRKTLIRIPNSKPSQITTRSMGVDKIEWSSQSGGAKAKNAVEAGVDGGDKLYVARAKHEGATVPGKLHMGHTHVYIPYNGAEVRFFCFFLIYKIVTKSYRSLNNVYYVHCR